MANINGIANLPTQTLDDGSYIPVENSSATGKTTVADLTERTSTESFETNGLTVTVWKCGAVKRMKITGTNTAEIASSGTTVTLGTLSSAFRPVYLYNQRHLITSTVFGQVIITAAGAVQLTSTINIDGSTVTNANIAASSTVRVEAVYI